MQKHDQKFYTSPERSENERDRLLALREETLGYQKAGGIRKAMEKQKKPLTAVQKFYRIGFNILFWILVSAFCAIMFTAVKTKRSGEIPAILGYSILRVQTGSMVPTLPIGCYVVVRSVDHPDEIQEGTITTFRFTNGTVVTHRIIEVLKDDNGGVQYRTKGDNPINDPDPELLSPERVIGVFQFRLTLPALWGGT